MDRHDSTAQASLKPIPSDQFSLSRVHPGLSRSSRMVRADFKVRSATQVFEVQFSQHRLREHLAVTIPQSEQSEVALYALVALSTLVFVGGAVALTGSVVFGLVVAALLPGFYALITATKNNRFCRQKAILKLTHTPDGHLLLTLMTTPKRRAVHPAASAITTIHLSQAPVHAIQSGPTMMLSETSLFCHQVNFTLLGPQSRRLNQLRIAGSRQEIRWLCRHLEAWGQMPRDCGRRSQDTP